MENILQIYDFFQYVQQSDMNFNMIIRDIHTTNPPTLLQEGVSLSMSIVPVEPVLLLSVSESG